MKLTDGMVFIPDAEREDRYDFSLAEGERVGFVFPIYSWAPPKLVLDFIQKMRFSAPPAYLYFVCTCGDNCGQTEKIVRRAVRAKGWELSACCSVQMPETYIGMPGFKLDTDANALRKTTDAEVKIAHVANRLLNEERFSDMTVGGFAWLKSRVINPGFNRFATDDSKYRYTDQCIHCGKCVDICPLKNISLDEGHPKWHGHCTMCMACYHHCPVNAIQYGKATVGKGQYYYGYKANDITN